MTDKLKAELSLLVRFSEEGRSGGKTEGLPEGEEKLSGSAADLLFMLSGIKPELLKLLRKIENDPRFDLESRKRLRENILRLVLQPAEEGGVRPELLLKARRVPTKEEHYSRNLRMPVESLPQSPEEARAMGWNDHVACDCHQFTSKDRSNVKFVSPDGRSEVIFDSQGHMVTAPEDYGTYNFSDSSVDPVGHFYQDVLPWLIWGNEENDTTDISQRLEAFVVYGGAAAVAAGLDELDTAGAEVLSRAAERRESLRENRREILHNLSSR